jgi:cell fate (sporulation/competence/biofilm development) regulator YlbF (YheA/YmcA/DUF963 family)
MELMAEITQTAQELGVLLGAEASVNTYLTLVETVQQNAETAALEARFDQLFQKLAEQEQLGQPLDRGELDEYYALKRQVQAHPLIIERNDQHTAIQALFAETAQQMTTILGFDYTAFAR